MLAFLSLLVVTYVAFSSSAVRNSTSLANAEFRSPDVNSMFDDADADVFCGVRTIRKIPSLVRMFLATTLVVKEALMSR